MLKLREAFILLFLLNLSAVASATTITGADGPLDLSSDYVLPYRADSIYDFSLVNIGSGATLQFDSSLSNVTLLSLGDIE